MEKLNAYEYHKNLTTEERWMQTVYLAEDENRPERYNSYSAIGRLVGYAASTVRIYSTKYIHLLEKAKERFFSGIKEVVSGIVKKCAIVFGKGTKLCYLFKFYDSDGNLLFSKIGKTIRNIQTRAREEIEDYRKNYDIKGVIIESVIDCGDVNPELAESQARSFFGQRYKGTFRSKDRFLYDIPTEEFNECVNNYLAQFA